MEKKETRRWDSSGFCVKTLGKSFRIMTAGGSLKLPLHKIAPEEMLQRTHTHFTYELLFAPDCKMTLVSEGGIETFSHKVVLVPPGFKHCSMVEGGNGYNLLVLPQFDVGEYPAVSADAPVVLELGEDVGFYIRQLASEWDSESGSEVAEHLASLILYHVFGRLLGEETLAKAASPTIASPIGMIEAYINSNYAKNITLDDLSPIVHLCNKQVARIIKREYGMTLSQLLAQKRVGAAEMLLKNSNLKISEIAERVSPGAENYFFVAFKKLTGMSPLQYRKTYQ
ncbi:MAG: helix-turn-helix transcriptional regulator [Clostridia bacterium]|nr:helix-turn-helix transcriptional regulator [Clostridia bacterium]